MSVKADIFIIPNGLIKSKGDFGAFDGAGKEYPYHGVMVEVWITSGSKTPENVPSFDSSESFSENWGNHGYPKCIKTPEGSAVDGRWSYLAPSYFPLEVFEGKKEGDKVKVNFHGNDVELTLSQNKYRYRGNGEFHEVLERLKGRFSG